MIKKIAVSLLSGLLLLAMISGFFITTTQESEAMKRGHHETLMQKTFETLANDGHDHITEWFTDMGLREDLLLGARQADLWGENRDHYYNPETGEGLQGMSDARTRFKEKVRSANENLLEGNYEDLAHDVGWATHLLQDMAVPHHVHNEPLDGHVEFEEWIGDNTDLNSTSSGGYYDFERDEWGDRVHWMAEFSYDYFDMVNSTANETQYEEAWSDLNPRVIRISASFLEDFFSTMVEHKVTLRSTQVTEDSISITWARDYSENFSHYRVIVAENETGLREEDLVYETEIDAISINSHTISGLDQLTEYYIRVEVVREVNSTETLRSHILEERTKWPYATIVTLGILLSAISFAITNFIRYKGYDKKAKEYVEKRR